MADPTQVGWRSTRPRLADATRVGSLATRVGSLLSAFPSDLRRGRRQVGGGPKAALATLEVKLLFILMYQKTYPIQTVQGLSFGLSQPRTNELIHELMPILDAALTQLGYRPERDPAAFPDTYAEVPLSARAFQIDGTERRRLRPKNAEKQGKNYSGKKKRTRIKT